MRSAASWLVLVPGLGACQSEYQPNGSSPDADLRFNPADPRAVSNTDTFEQVQRPAVDVLWVIDNSCSMADQQGDLAESAPLFMEYFLDSGLDYHIGVVSTDMRNPDQSGKLVTGPGNIRWITPETPDAVDAFAGVALLGVQGGVEMGLGATYAALALQTSWNDGFFREASGLHIIVLSDESDYTDAAIITQSELVNVLQGLRAEPDAVSFHSIVSPPEGDCPGVSTRGTDYIGVTHAVGGVYWSLCDPWEGALEAVGLAAIGLQREFFLSQVPVDGSVEVIVNDAGNHLTFDEVDPVSGQGDWVYTATRNSVTFLDYLPPPGAIVSLHYDVLAAAERD
jgi:hypothetical protein